MNYTYDSGYDTDALKAPRRRAALRGRIAALRTLIVDTEGSLQRLRDQLGAAEDALAEEQPESHQGEPS